jgi:AraC-like DNA-binding protein
MLKPIDIGQVEGQAHYQMGWNRNHLYFGKPKDEVTRLVRFRPHYLQRGLPQRLKLHFKPPFVEINKTQCQKLDRLADFLTDVETTNPQLLSAYLNLLVEEACTLFRQQNDIRHVHAHERLLVRLLELVEQNFRTELRTGFYGNVLGVVDRKLNEICKQGTGFLVMELIEMRRMEEAEAQLGMGRGMIKSIAAELNFCSTGHFTQWFFKRQGKRPKEYRDELLKEKTQK